MVKFIHLEYLDASIKPLISRARGGRKAWGPPSYVMQIFMQIQLNLTALF